MTHSAHLSAATIPNQAKQSLKRSRHFLKAGSVTAASWWSMQNTWLNHTQHMGAVAMRGRAPALKEITDLNTEDSRLGA